MANDGWTVDGDDGWSAGDDGWKVEPDRPDLMGAPLGKVSEKYQMGPIREGATRVMRGVNKGLDSLGNVIADPINATGRALGLDRDLVERDWATNTARDASGAVDAITGGGDGVYDGDVIGPAETTGEKFLEGVGEGVSMMAPAAGAARAVAVAGKGLSGVRGLIAGGADDLAAATAAAPVKTLAIEGLAGGGSAAGGAGAADITESDDPTVRLVGSVLGGAAATLGPSGLMRISPTRMLGEFVKGAIRPLTNAGGKAQAGQRLRRLAGGGEAPNQYAEKILANKDSGLSPAEITGDENLLALQKSIIDQDETLQREFKKHSEGAVKSLRASLDDVGEGVSPQASADYFAARRAHLTELLDVRIVQAQETAAQIAARANPDNPASSNSMTLRRELDLAETDAYNHLDQTWAEVPRGAKVQTSALSQQWNEIVASAPDAAAPLIPKIAKDLLGAGGKWMEDDGLSPEQTVNQMHGLYSELRRVARNAMAGTDPKPKTAAYANQLAESILEDLGVKAGEATEVGKLVKAALDETFIVKETFSRGTVGKILGRTADGGQAIEPAATLDRTVRRGGAQAAIDVDQMMTATNGRGVDAIDDYILGEFERRVMKDGKVSKTSAETFFKNNKELLEQFPDVRARLDAAVDGAAQSQRVADSSAARRSAINDPKKSAGAKFAGANEGDEFNAILRSQKPAAAAAALKREARRDKTGKAMKGLKTSLTNFLLKGARTKGLDDGSMVSGSAMRQQWASEEVQKVARVILGKDELAKINRRIADFQSIEKAVNSAGLKGGKIMGKRPAAEGLVTWAASTIGARLGAKAGAGTSGASLKTASAGSNIARDWVSRFTVNKAEKFLKEAQSDPELYASLMMDPKTIDKKSVDRLSRVLAGILADGEDDDGPDENGGDGSDDLGGSQGDDLVNDIVDVESSGRADAKNSRSSATGAGQFIDSTWMEMMRRYEPDLMRGKSKGQVLAMRGNKRLSTKMVARYRNQNKAILEKSGVSPTRRNLYLMHFGGPTGGKRVITAPEDMPLTSIFSKKEMDANPHMQGKTAGWLRRWAARKMRR